MTCNSHELKIGGKNSSKREVTVSDSNQSPIVHRLSGLKAPVEIAIDRWGLAHLRADNASDLFFAQGFNAARDRLWQIDLWRKRGLGLLAADFGPGYLAQDEASRLFLYRGDMEPEWAAYATDARDICEAFVAGINAYVEEVGAGRLPLPLEFKRLGTRPACWSPEDVVRIRSHCLTRNALSEIVRANVVAAAGEAAEGLRKKIEPHCEIDPKIDPSIVPLAVADVFKLATANVTFDPERLHSTLDDARGWSKLNSIGEVIAAADSEGSNNWAVHGSRTSTGRPIMATDPHRTHAIPSLRYLVHLEMPGFSAIGAGEPAVPGIALGHNDRAAFSITIFGADQEDVLIYDLDPDNPNRYRYQDRYEDMVEVEERFEIKGEAPQTRALFFTRHGPIVHRDATHGRAFAIRTVWSEPGAAPYMASLSVMRAGDVATYRDALRGWGTPSINHIYADVDGNIGWQTVGKTPIRSNWNGLLPVPGDGTYEWDGHLNLDQLPHSFNPERGYVATANEMNVPEGWPLPAAIGHEWIDKSRAQRIQAILDGQSSHSLDDSQRLQNDMFSFAASRFIKVLTDLVFEDECAERARRHLIAWDCVATAGSSPAALHEVWTSHHLRPALYARAGGENIVNLLQPGDIQAVLDVVEAPQIFFGDDGHDVLRQLLAETLAAAWRQCEDKMGSNPWSWAWGTLHQLVLHHALDNEKFQTSGDFSLLPVPVGGTGSTPMYASYRPDDFVVITGPSVRMVMDVGDWDRSSFINLPGQSGDSSSPHYADLLDDWCAGRYHPLSYTRAAVDAVTERVVRLEPM